MLIYLNSIFSLLNAITVTIGLPLLINLLVTTGRKLQFLEDLGITMKNQVIPDLKDVRERFSMVEGKMDIVWKDRERIYRSTKKDSFHPG